MVHYNTMTGKRAYFEQAVEQIAGAIDRGSSVSVSVQLRGALEFGIASGDLPEGLRLPSVRALAERLSLSPVTVSNVYASLQKAGHIEGRIGQGTFVSGSATRASAANLQALENRIAELIEMGRSCGLSRAELALRVSMTPARARRHMRLLMVGNFHDATAFYAAEIRNHLRDGDSIEAATLESLTAETINEVDLIVAPKTLLPTLRDMRPGKPVVGLTLIPNEATRVALASIASDAKVVGYSYFPGFVAIMKSGILRFAPHVGDLSMVVRDEPGAEAAIARAEVLIYATGAEYLRDRLTSSQQAFEYRHTPEMQAVRTELLPAIEARRTALTTEQTKEETT